MTQLRAALLFYGVSLRYARTPQAKGKIERQYQYWQGRLPALFAAEIIIGDRRSARYASACVATWRFQLCTILPKGVCQT